MNYVKNAITVAIFIGLLLLAERFLPGFWLTLLLLFGINTILAVSLNITNGWANLFSLGHGGIMLVGGYVAAFLTLPVSFKHDLLDLALPAAILNHQVSFLPALLIGGIVGALFGVILALPAMRLKGLYFLLATLGLNFITITIVENIPEITNGPDGSASISGTHQHLVGLGDCLPADRRLFAPAALFLRPGIDLHWTGSRYGRAHGRQPAQVQGVCIRAELFFYGHRRNPVDPFDS